MQPVKQGMAEEADHQWRGEGGKQEGAEEHLVAKHERHSVQQADQLKQEEGGIAHVPVAKGDWNPINRMDPARWYTKSVLVLTFVFHENALFTSVWLV